MCKAFENLYDEGQKATQISVIKKMLEEVIELVPSEKITPTPKPQRMILCGLTILKISTPCGRSQMQTEAHVHQHDADDAARDAELLTRRQFVFEHQYTDDAHHK